MFFLKSAFDLVHKILYNDSLTFDFYFEKYFAEILLTLCHLFSMFSFVNMFEKLR